MNHHRFSHRQALLGMGLTSFPAFAESKRVVGEIPASGFIFKAQHRAGCGAFTRPGKRKKHGKTIGKC
jgi:hypothetical protein